MQYRHTSSLKKIVHCVPQGSILGHLLLLLCINELPLNIQGVKLVLSADSNNILFVDKNHDVLQQKNFICYERIGVMVS